MKIKRHHRKNIITDLYTIEYKNKMFYFIKHQTGSGKEINKEIRKQDGEVLNPINSFTIELLNKFDCLCKTKNNTT
jgi:hypothetical protein